MKGINFFKLSQGITFTLFVLLFSFDHFVVDQSPTSEDSAHGYIFIHRDRNNFVHFLKLYQVILIDLLGFLFILFVFLTIAQGIPIVIKMRRGPKGD